MSAQLSRHTLPIKDFSSNGAVMIEIVLGLPIFMGLLLMLLWLSTVLNAQTALTSAVSVGVRGGATRGNARLMGYQRMWTQFQNQPDSGAAIILPLDWAVVHHTGLPKEFLSSDSSLEDAVPEALGELVRCPECLYAYAYTTQFLSSAVGGEVRYPCRPNDPDDPRRGAGCVWCTFEGAGAFAGGPASGEGFAMTCEYSPSMILTRMILGLLGTLDPDATAADLLLIRRRGVYVDN